jgi:hypothetical protein
MNDSTEKANHSKHHFHCESHKHLSLYLHAQRSPAPSISRAEYSKTVVSWVSMFLHQSRRTRKKKITFEVVAE